MHFLDRECREIYQKKAVAAAVHCAVDMQRAVEIHMKGLRKILHHDSPLFGAGIAIDVGEAFWSCDHRDNPVVVGKVVVGACRVGDKAPRESVRLTNLAYWKLGPRLRKQLVGITRKPLRTKESIDEVPLECWEFNVTQELSVGLGLNRIEELCKEIKKRFDGEKEAGKP